MDLLRLDSDVAGSYARLQDVLDRFAEPGPKVLVGTQMIAKGHHFPDVTLVGVVNADLTLHFPDFRAEERTFALLVQVGGRSGRGDRPGRVIVQTLDPEARPIALAAAGEEERFYAEELERRRELGYPPARLPRRPRPLRHVAGEGRGGRALHGGAADRPPRRHRPGARPRTAVAGARPPRLPGGGKDYAKQGKPSMRCAPGWRRTATGTRRAASGSSRTSSRSGCDPGVRYH